MRGVAGADRLLGQDEVGVAQGQGLGADQAGIAGERDEDDDEDQRARCRGQAR